MTAPRYTTCGFCCLSWVISAVKSTSVGLTCDTEVTVPPACLKRSAKILDTPSPKVCLSLTTAARSIFMSLRAYSAGSAPWMKSVGTGRTMLVAPCCVSDGLEPKMMSGIPHWP